jgi:DNA-binding transcriptional MerR regulator
MIMNKITVFYMRRIRPYTETGTRKDGADMDKEEQALVQNLLDAGCCPSDCKAFLRLPENEQKAMLEEKRRELLGELHTAKEKLDCLDYLRYQYQK